MIWSACKGANHIGNITGTLYRLVESQEQVATMGYVDTLDEQALLEDMLEQVKPPYLEDVQGYHYLLTTPFRYPPLKWGSHFGSIHEPSLFYAGCSPSAALAESAYYRFVFLYSMEDITDWDKIRSEHAMFSAGYHTDKGVQLHTAPFNESRPQLTDPQNYSHTQQLGSDMRVAGVKAFEYESAHDPDYGLCVGLYDISVFRHKSPQSMTQWLCETSAQAVSFKQFATITIAHFALEDFWVNGELPLLAK